MDVQGLPDTVYAWKISIAGFGDFLYIGTEPEAEKQRELVAREQGGVGTKELDREVTNEELNMWGQSGPFEQDR
jgi:hypothetical protein